MYAKAYIRNKLLKVNSEISKLINLYISKLEFELVKAVVDGLHKLM